MPVDDTCHIPLGLTSIGLRPREIFMEITFCRVSCCDTPTKCDMHKDVMTSIVSSLQT